MQNKFKDTRTKMISDVILDIESLRRVTDGDVSLESALIRLYCQTAERCISQLKSAASSKDRLQWQKLTHELHGASVNIHANQMAALCKYAEHEDDLATRLQVCEKLEKALVTLKAFCSSWLQ
jgi:HPt (histidine-containing phosphotransfer) domain-containing protein